MKWFAHLLLAVCGLVLSAAEPVRTWTNLKGITMKAAFVKFAGDKIEIIRKDGVSFKVSPSIFSAEDRKYLDELRKSEPDKEKPAAPKGLLKAAANQRAQLPQGAILIASIQGAVKVTNNTTGQPLPIAEYVVGKLLFEGLTVNTGKLAEVILLFSNGTVVTIGSSTNVKLKKFSQGKFDAGDQLFRDWQEEPSLSDMRLSLDFGSLIVGTKKLKRESNFIIDSPVGKIMAINKFNKESDFNSDSSVGLAAIGSMQLKVTQEPGGTFFLEVAESTVTFMPKGGACNMLVKSGNGLNVTAGGGLVHRPVNSAAVQVITQGNAKAFGLQAYVPSPRKWND